MTRAPRLLRSCLFAFSSECQTARAQAPGDAAVDVRVRVAQAELRREACAVSATRTRS